MVEKNNDFDLFYLKSLCDNLVASNTSLVAANNKQTEQIGKLTEIAAGTKAILEGHSEKHREHSERVSDHDIRIRDVERVQDSCRAGTEISLIKKQMNRLIAFKDMILSKNNEDSSVIDVHAQRMKAAVESAMGNQIPWKILLWKMLPWLLLVFAFGIALATIIVTKSLSGEKVVIAPPDIGIPANLSSQKK